MICFNKIEKSTFSIGMTGSRKPRRHMSGNIKGNTPIDSVRILFVVFTSGDSLLQFSYHNGLNTNPISSHHIDSNKPVDFCTNDVHHHHDIMANNKQHVYFNLNTYTPVSGLLSTLFSIDPSRPRLSSSFLECPSIDGIMKSEQQRFLLPSRVVPILPGGRFGE